MKNPIEGLTPDEVWGKYKLEVLAGITIAVFVLLITFGGIVASGVILGLLTAFGTGIILFDTRHSMPRLWNGILKHPYMSRVVISAVLIMILGISVNALFAVAVCDIVSMLAIKLGRKYIGEVPLNKPSSAADKAIIVLPKVDASCQPVMTG